MAQQDKKTKEERQLERGELLDFLVNEGFFQEQIQEGRVPTDREIRRAQLSLVGKTAKEKEKQQLSSVLNFLSSLPERRVSAANAFMDVIQEGFTQKDTQEIPFQAQSTQKGLQTPSEATKKAGKIKSSELPPSPISEVTPKTEGLQEVLSSIQDVFTAVELPQLQGTGDTTASKTSQGSATPSQEAAPVGVPDDLVSAGESDRAAGLAEGLSGTNQLFDETLGLLDSVESDQDFTGIGEENFAAARKQLLEEKQRLEGELTEPAGDFSGDGSDIALALSNTLGVIGRIMLPFNPILGAALAKAGDTTKSINPQIREFQARQAANRLITDDISGIASRIFEKTTESQLQDVAGEQGLKRSLGLAAFQTSSDLIKGFSNQLLTIEAIQAKGVVDEQLLRIKQEFEQDVFEQQEALERDKVLWNIAHERDSQARQHQWAIQLELFKANTAAITQDQRQRHEESLLALTEQAKRGPDFIQQEEFRKLLDGIIKPEIIALIQEGDINDRSELKDALLNRAGELAAPPGTGTGNNLGLQPAAGDVARVYAELLTFLPGE